MRLKLPRLLRNVLRSTSFWQENRLILREFGHFPWVVVAAIAFALCSAAFEGFGFGFLLAFLQSLVGGASAPPFETGIAWFDVAILGIDRSKNEQLYRISALILSTTWVRAVFNYLTQVYTELSQQKLIDRLRKQTFEQLQAVNLSYFGQTNSGELINTLTGEIGKIQIAFGLMAYIITKSLTLLVYTFLLFAISWQLTIVSVVLFGIVIVGLTKLNRRVRESSFAVTAASGKFATIALELISGIRTVHAFATQDYERKRFYRASSEVLKTGMKASRRWALVRPMAEGLATTVLISMIILAITVFVANGTLQTASLLTFLFLLFRLVPALHEINGNRAQLSNYTGAFANISEVIRSDNKPYMQDGERWYNGLDRSIDFVAVEFGYTPGQPVLKDITLTIPKGKMTALVGGSGAGKTTLVDLIPRFYDPTHGQVLFDGVDVRSLAIKSLRRKMAIVSQDTFVFNASVRYNIAYGLDDVTDEMIFKAAQQANALDFILDMPEQFETSLGDRGVRLSGGQRQRLAIARALLRDPEILILDEATSALDSVSERLIQASLEQLAEGRTVIAIAHRLSTIVRADKVVVLEQGQIVEQGTYQELLNLRGRLWNYHRMQHELGVTG
ncbi:heterocyst formation ABC transporter subunit HepA [Myxacorys almedinensis]|uniref:ATP-binding cassette domain-containing protein n=1 Tax=Myxacorys almedinensis A TaxID=2690445 RepID=A0A8J7YXV6_9CYAN|nr:heterocyst formation ABC transporter subunit HepA [Myxacorys almedinensis]NDJ16627.1 ATP-binding cassette domain-containing protein [Myxacorys almedinensis A]